MTIQSTDLYTRKCQECGARMEYKPCVEYKGDSWTDTPCRKCKSPSLDYGSFGWSRKSVNNSTIFYREEESES